VFKEQTFLSRERVFHILVVDDERVIAETLATILQRSGFAAVSFTNPLEALNSTHSESPDLLLSDVMMPELSGVDLAIQIRERYPDCKILLFSGQAGTVDLLQAAQARGHHFRMLSKPVHPRDLIQEIKDIL
jgi:CheY-like chemotaxis protein